MQVINLPSLTIICVDVPKGCIHYYDELSIIREEFQIIKCVDYKDKSEQLHFMELPSGSWTILGRLDEITEEQARGIVEGKLKDYKCYKDENFCHYYATDGLKCLLKANQIEGNLLLLIETKK